MSLQRIEKIYCYAKPCKSHFQLLSSKTRLHPNALRSLHSETLIQKNNSILPKNGLQKNSYVQSLCNSFDLSCATNLSPLGILTKDKKKKEASIPMPVKPEPCKRCAKIRSNVKKFFSTKFVTANADETEVDFPEQQSKPIPMHIRKDEQNHVTLIPDMPIIKPVAISKPHAVCYGCDQPTREPSIRGPPIISPVCSVNASPKGEVYKNFPERIKRNPKIDRPRSVGLKKLPQKDQRNETSVHESVKSNIKTTSHRKEKKKNAI